jgi:hypothetical protein
MNGIFAPLSRKGRNYIRQLYGQSEPFFEWFWYEFGLPLLLVAAIALGCWLLAPVVIG